MLLGMIIVSCSTNDGISDELGMEQPTAKQVDLLMSIGNSAMKPRQAPSNTRRAATFQGMELLVAIPFHTNNASVAVTDEPLIDLVGAAEDPNRVENHNNYYVDHCQLMTGTNRMLVYGKSKPVDTNPAINGKLSDLPTIRTKTENITFSLVSMHSNPLEIDDDATALANYMTRIANTEGWSTTTDPTLKSYYLDFIRSDGDDGGLMSGAAANIKAFVAALKVVLLERKSAVSDDIKNIIDAIITNIENKIVSIDETDYNIEQITYPRSIGLPDGAAVIRWMKNEETGNVEFCVRTTTTTLDNINGINRYTYPAELVFFTDSPIRTSTEEVSKATYQTTDKLWDAFLDTYYNGSSAVNNKTKAVAVEKPLQYGVANLQLTLTSMAATLRDAKDMPVTNADMTHLPLKGVIIGGQHTVGHNMKPRGEQTDVDGRFIYETTVDNTSIATQGYKTNTLVLQSYDDEKVPVILEFENKTGSSFTGKDGTVYPNTRFYLIGLIDPADKKEAGKDYTNRVFTQDYTTTMSMSVSSLANAYTSMPDLLAPRLEVGVQVVTKWIQATTTNVEL
jgi:hypothetical protein